MFCGLIVLASFNTYRGWAVVFVHGSAEFLYSREGVAQGDPLSMFLCDRYSSSHLITEEAEQVDSGGLKTGMLTMLLHVLSCLIFMNALISSSIMDHGMVMVQIHLNIMLLVTLLVMIVLYRFLAL